MWSEGRGGRDRKKCQEKTALLYQFGVERKDFGEGRSFEKGGPLFGAQTKEFREIVWPKKGNFSLSWGEESIKRGEDTKRTLPNMRNFAYKMEAEPRGGKRRLWKVLEKGEKELRRTKCWSGRKSFQGRALRPSKKRGGGGKKEHREKIVILQSSQEERPFQEKLSLENNFEEGLSLS